MHVGASALHVGVEVLEEPLGVLGRHERVEEDGRVVRLEVHAADVLPPLLVVGSPAPEPRCDPMDVDPKRPSVRILARTPTTQGGLMRMLIALPAIVLAASITATSSTPATKVLRGTVGPSFTITVKNAAGKVVKTTKAGTYRLTVTDKSTFHDFHLIGPGINRVVTTVPFTGSKTVTVKLKVGRYIYQCDPHRLNMKASFRVAA